MTVRNYKTRKRIFRLQRFAGMSAEERVESVIARFVQHYPECNESKQLRYLMPGSTTPMLRKRRPPLDAVKSVLRQYSFVLVTERFNESLVVLAHMWNLTLADLLYVKSKDKPEYAVYSIGPGEKEVTIVSSRMEKQSARVREYLEGQTFKERNIHDYMLYEIANRALDERRRRIPGFDGLLARFERALDAIAGDCAGEVRLGDGNDCLWRDGGCAVRCRRQRVASGEGAYAGLADPLDDGAVRRLATLRDHTRNFCGGPKAEGVRDEVSSPQAARDRTLRVSARVDQRGE